MEIKTIKLTLAEQACPTRKKLPACWAKAFRKAPDIQCAVLTAAITQFEMGYFRCLCINEGHGYCLCRYDACLIEYGYTFLEFWHDNVNLLNQRDAFSPKAVRHIRFRMKQLRSWYLLPLLKRRYRRIYKRSLGHEIDDGYLDRLVRDSAYF